MDVKNKAVSTIGYTLPPGVYKITDTDSMLKSLFPGRVRVNITIDDFRLKSNLDNNKTNRFTKQSFINTILGFTE